MGRCWPQGAIGNALHALRRAAGYNIRWLLRATVRLGLGRFSYTLSAVAACLTCLLQVMLQRTRVMESARTAQRRPSSRAPSWSLRALG
jgi:hypothetical protein